ncbi:hypothetical protein F5Y12DRAFT_796543 [Xylaria sp. FL1777]|nr:hypothetical protein F5Y12DRAFT_796543 [Xylaria sp. FL1777]
MEGEPEQATVRTTVPIQTVSHPTNDHEHRSVRSEDLQLDSSTPQAFDAPVINSNTASLTWRPFYLRRTVLLGFTIVFILIVVALESLTAISHKNNGIATGMPTEHYLWTYGPTAILTAVAAVWARTEYQSKLVAPWIRLWENRRSKRTATASRTLLLDYVSQFSIFATVNSFRNRDFVVFITLMVSIIIKVLIVLSSGLISLELTNVTRDSYPMILESKFIDSNARLNTTGNLAWYMMTGLASRTLTLPEGISSEYAFQSVQTDLPNTVLETRVTADGLRSSLQCDAVNLTLVEAQPLNRHHSINSLNVTISSPNCSVTQMGIPGVAQSDILGDNFTLFARFEQVQCDRVEGNNGKRVLVLFGNLTYYTETSQNVTDYGGNTVNPLAGILNRSTQLLCVPTYSMDKVEVIHNGKQIKSTTLVPGSPSRMLESVTAWDIMEAQFVAIHALFDFVQAFSHSTNISMVPVDVDVSMETALKFSLPPNSQAGTLFEPAVLQNTAEVYYQQIGAIISKQSLMEPVSEMASGSAIISENRLIIHTSIAQSMVGLLIVCILLSTVAIFIVPTDGFLPHSPSTLLCLISLFLYSRDLIARLRYSGASDGNHLARGLAPFTFASGLAYDTVSSQTQFYVNVDAKDDDQGETSDPVPQISSRISHPIILHPVARSILCLTAVGLIITLELLLLRSNLEDGLGDIKDDNMYIHYTWTAVPAIVLGALSIAYSTVDSQIRTLVPYVALKGHVSKDVFKQLELLDMTIPVAMYKEFKLKQPWALATSTALLFASLFTTLSASLFQELLIPSTTSILLQANQSFDVSGFGVIDTDTPLPDSSAAISLILESNLSFPHFTFNDLAFPQFVPVSNLSASKTSLNASTVSISTVIPAVRGRMDCHSYEKVHANITLNYTTLSGDQNPLQVLVDAENFTFELGTTSNATYVGQAYPGSWTYGDVVYLWGKIDYNANPVIQHIDVMGCRITFETVDVNTTFIGTDLDIDFQTPPQPLNSTAQNTTINNVEDGGLEYVKTGSYTTLANIDVGPQILDAFFEALVTSAWAIPMSALGDPSSSASVVAAIKFQHGIIQAQTLAQTLHPANQTNATLAEPIGPADNNARPLYNATVTDAESRRRVVQDATSTHVLVALLSISLVLFLVGWAGNPRTDVLPRSPTTIASVAALIAGGNLLSYLHPDAQSLEDIIAALGGPKARFWMGWGNLPDEEGRLRGGENEAGVSQFGIFVVDEEETKSK